MAAHNEFGTTAERLAADHLVAEGWTVLDRNWRWGHKEVDLIARRGDTVAFIEVRARRTALFGHPFATLGPRKRRELEAAARVWIARHGRPADDYRFDAIAVIDPTGTGRGPDLTLEHLSAAWMVRY